MFDCLILSGLRTETIFAPFAVEPKQPDYICSSHCSFWPDVAVSGKSLIKSLTQDLSPN
jgi:hypothetical protein